MNPANESPALRPSEKSVSYVPGRFVSDVPGCSSDSHDSLVTTLMNEVAHDPRSDSSLISAGARFVGPWLCYTQNHGQSLSAERRTVGIDRVAEANEGDPPVHPPRGRKKPGFEPMQSLDEC
jgi:hypothetical protein